MRHTLALLFVVLFTISAQADDSIWVYKRFFKETYHLDRNCPTIAGKKVLAFSLSDETETRQKMRNAIQLADPCTVCKTPNIRNTRDNRLDDVLAEYLGISLSMEEDDEESNSEVGIPFTSASLFDDEIIAALPENGKVTSSIYQKRGQRYKMLVVKKALHDAIVGCPIVCEVVSSRKSNMFGREGELVIRPLYLTTEDGTVIRMKPNDIVIRGKNRQNLKFWTFPTVVSWFIPGGGAKILSTDEFVITLDPLADTAANGMKKKEMEAAEAAAEEGDSKENED